MSQNRLPVLYRCLAIAQQKRSLRIDIYKNLMPLRFEQLPNHADIALYRFSTTAPKPVVPSMLCCPDLLYTNPALVPHGDFPDFDSRNTLYPPFSPPFPAPISFVLHFLASLALPLPYLCP